MSEKRKFVVAITAQFSIGDMQDLVNASECANEAIEKLREHGSVESRFEFEDGILKP